MRWDELFRDLEAQADAAAADDLASEVAQRTRQEAGRLRMVDRLRPALGAAVGVQVAGLGAVSGRLVEVGSQWLLLDEGAGRSVLVPLTGVLAVSGLGVGSAVPGSEGAVLARLGLASALRGVAQDRAPVTVVLADASVVTGTVDRVGADFLEITEHASGEARRRDRVGGVRVVPFEALAAVRST